MGRSSSFSSSDESLEHRKRKRRHKKEKKEKKHKKEKHKKEKRAKHDFDGGPPHGVMPITTDDYFRRAQEFQRWLQESRGKFLEELPSDEAHKLFSKFVSKWNSGGLSSQTYSCGRDGIDVQRTRHRWDFASKLSAEEQLQLESTRDSIQAQTRRAAGQGRDGAAIERAASVASRAHISGIGRSSRRALDDASSAFDEAAALLGVDTTKPDAGSREAMLEKRRAQTAYHRRSDEEEGMPAMSDSALMGANSDEFAACVARRQQAAAHKSEVASARVQELQAKERERMENFKRQMGL